MNRGIALSSMLVSSLQNRIRAMNIIWQRAVSDMTLDQVNHHERAGVLPIAFTDFDAWRAYQSEVIAGTDRALDPLTADALAEVLMPQLPPNMQNIFCA